MLIRFLLYCDSLFLNVIHDGYLFDCIRSPSICKLHEAVITHAVSTRNKEPTMLIRFYCIAILSSRMLYMIGIKEIRFLWHQISLDLQTTWGCHYACSINLIIQHVEHTLYLSHIPGMLQDIQHQKEQLYCLPSIRLKTSVNIC